MKTFRFKAVVTISLSTTVEAESLKEAQEIAEGRPLCTLMSPDRMGESADDRWVHSGELDGTPEEVEEDV